MVFPTKKGVPIAKITIQGAKVQLFFETAKQKEKKKCFLCEVLHIWNYFRTFAVDLERWVKRLPPESLSDRREPACAYGAPPIITHLSRTYRALTTH